MRNSNVSNEMAITIVNDTIMSSNESTSSVNNISIMDIVDNNNDQHTYHNDINKMSLFKDLILSLEEKIDGLKEQVTFLRTDSSNKSIIINNLLAITRRNMLNVTTSSSSDSIISSYNNKASNNNKEIYKKQPDNVISSILNELNESISTPVKKDSSEQFTYQSFPLYEMEDGEEKNDENDDNDEEEKVEEVEKEEHEDLYSEITSDGQYSTSSMNTSAYELVPTDMCNEDKCQPIVKNNEKENTNNKKKWPENTILITGDSILNNIQEDILRKKFNVKVRPFPGADVNDMYDYIAPLLRKEPKYIILHIGSNDAPYKTSSDILDDILKLKTHIESVLPNVAIYLSSPIPRFDNVTAGYTIHHLRNKMKDLNFKIIQNDNIDANCIGKIGLHPNGKGTGRLAMNYISLMKRL